MPVSVCWNCSNDNFGPGDKLIATQLACPDVAAQAYRTRAGRKLLLVNKENAAITLNLPPGAAGARMDFVAPATGENPPQRTFLSETQVTLAPFAVAVVRFEGHD